MTQQRAITAYPLSVAFLISACLSFVRATETLGEDGFQVEVVRPQLLQQNCLIDQGSVSPSGERGCGRCTPPSGDGLDAQHAVVDHELRAA